MNPARTFGPDLVGKDFSDYWIYVAGPLVGALLAVGCAWVLRGAGGGRAGVRRRTGSYRDGGRAARQGVTRRDCPGLPTVFAGLSIRGQLALVPFTQHRIKRAPSRARAWLTECAARVTLRGREDFVEKRRIGELVTVVRGE